MSKAAKPNTFSYTSPYHGFWLEHFYGMYAENIFGSKVITEADLRKKMAASDWLPEVMLMGNFIVERAGILSLCRELGINTLHAEDGFFPHYTTIHGDPLGFAWESSLSRMAFRSCSDRQRLCASSFRKAWLEFAPQPLPAAVKKPFLFWPLQLVADKVNQWDLNVKDWTGLLRCIRRCLPPEFQLVLKEHPRSQPRDLEGIYELVRELPNTIVVPTKTHLKTLLSECIAVAGANSSVLYEARLMFHKPAYVFAKGWFTNHAELFMPVRPEFPRDLPRLDWLSDNRAMRTTRLDDYTDWFLAHLLGRQIDHSTCQGDPKLFKEWVNRLSYNSYLRYGEDIFVR